MSGDVFDDLTEVYEAFVDWPKRLANEAAFYRDLFARCRARRVLDVACGTGQHAAMFHDWGLEVEGADVSPQMIARARSRSGPRDGLSWAVRSFEQPVAAPGTFDVAICVGNSLALAPDRATVERAIRELLAAVRGGGRAVVHVLNLWRLPDGPCVWQKSRRAELGQGKSLLIKGVHRSGSRGFVEVLVARLDQDAPLRHESVPFVGLESGELEAVARRSGARTTTFFGDYQGNSYRRDESVDLLMVVEK